MTYFAKVENGIVSQVIVATEDFINSGCVGDPNQWIETSLSKTFRKNYAGIGFTYDSDRDAFIPPKPAEGTWALNEDTCLWEAVEE